jgi:hypothetical protein
MPNHNRAREDRGGRAHEIDLIETRSSAAISLNPLARPGSALPGHVQGDDHSATRKGRLAPEVAGRVTLPPRHNTREVAGMVPHRVPGKEQTAACG